MSDSIVRSEINRLKAINVRSDYELEVMKDIQAWAAINKLDKVLSTKQKIQAYWDKKLN